MGSFWGESGRHSNDDDEEEEYDEEEGEEEEEDEEEEEEKVVVKTIIVKVKREQQGEPELSFRIEPDIPLRWLMVSYCTQAHLRYGSTRFVFNGTRLRETDTPHQLSMLNSDIIYAFPADPQGGHGRNSTIFATLCIRMHKEKDKFLRVTRTSPILPQLVRNLLSDGTEDADSLSFVYNGDKLTEAHTADGLNIDDGDIIDAFDFNKNSSSLSFLGPSIAVNVVSSAGESRGFKLRRTTSLGCLIRKYCELKSLKRGAVFTFNGRRLSCDMTAEEAQLNDGDTINVFYDYN